MTIRRKNRMSAVVLCGGKSQRAGFDKQTIRIGGKLIAEWIACELLRVLDDVTLVTSQPDLYRDSDTRIRVVEDIYPNMGPLGGIHAGLMSCEHEIAFVTACDMPNIDLSYLRFLKREAARSKNGFDAMAVRLDNGMFEPLQALYPKRAVPQIEQMLSCGERKTADLLQRLNTRYLSEEDLIPFGGKETLFFNMNTPEEIRLYIAKMQMREEKQLHPHTEYLIPRKVVRRFTR